MTTIFYSLLILSVATVSMSQRPFYAGTRSIGYPEVQIASLANRFGNDQPLPLEARGDPILVNRINQMPVDKQPFWYINRMHYDNLRRNPQTWQPNPNSFANVNG
ncbi:hypothetical protein EVAR_25757_1 [Eumeta japonica]|uniref:Seminal fluid protein HACP044 n=1 Tax=Eumeta variegata TaxID=151549 RepID=A0A4C1V8T2_EUMVA|nr:hypothetical protein EVAR_25757_1 [Eumeta japonica]